MKTAMQRKFELEAVKMARAVECVERLSKAIYRFNRYSRDSENVTVDCRKANAKNVAPLCNSNRYSLRTAVSLYLFEKFPGSSATCRDKAACIICNQDIQAREALDGQFMSFRKPTAKDV